MSHWIHPEAEVELGNAAVYYATNANRVIAEAQQMLGAIRLKQLIKRDTRGSFIVAWCTPGTACGATAGNGWAGLGLQDIPAQATYAYTCPDVTGTGVPTFCITTPILGSPAGAIRIDLATGFWGCNTPYRPLPNNQGCTI